MNSLKNPKKRIPQYKNEELNHIEKILCTVNKINQNSYTKNKPHRNIILTSPSNLNKFDGTFNSLLNNFRSFKDEIKDIHLLPELFYEHREKLLLSGSGDYDEDVIVSLHINLFHLFFEHKERLKEIINEFGYRIIAVIQSPVQTILEWNQKQSLNTPEACVTDDCMHPIWNSITFEPKEKFDRQAAIWNLYAQFYWSLKNIIKIYTFEQIIQSSELFFKDLCNYLLIPLPDSYEIPINMNNEVENCNIEEIYTSVQKYCPMRFEYNYDNTSSQIPGIWDKDSVIFCRSVPKLS